MSKNYNGKLNIDVSGFNNALKEAKANLALVSHKIYAIRNDVVY